jgi:flagellar motor switch protein FliM
MDRCDVDIEEEASSRSEAVSYNLTSQNIMLRDQFSALEQVYDKFATLLNTTLSAVLQRSLEIDFVSSELVKYEECISAFSSPSSFVIFKQEPLIGNALLAMEPGLVFSLIDCMFGGTGRPTGRIRDFTMIEQRMIRKVSTEILDCLETAWKIVQPTKIELRKVETKPEYVHLVSLNDLMVVIIFSIKGKEFSGSFHLCMSYLMLEPIKEKLSSKYLREKDIANTWSREIRRLLKNTSVDLTAELGRTTQSIRNLLELQVEDVLQLNTGPEDLIQLTIDNVPKYLGYPGVIKGSRAVEIVELLDRNGGED